MTMAACSSCSSLHVDSKDEFTAWPTS